MTQGGCAIAANMCIVRNYPHSFRGHTLPAPKTTIWDLEPHTKAKHEILKRYMQAWMPIMGMRDLPQIAYIDGFAGPGRYSMGEDGSPIIALKAALEQQSRITSTISFLFVEEHRERAATLQAILDELEIPSHFRTKVFAGETFEQAIEGLLNSLWVDKKNLPPTFAFIDPFGWSGVPFSTARRILGFPSCEVLVTFMYEEINRFIGHPDQEENFNSFFGTDKWKGIVSILDARERNRRLHDLYVNQLRESANVKYVRSFEMRNDKDVTDYYLFYATNSLTGLKKMKEAMWKVDSSGESRFSDATDPRQSVFFINEPQFEKLQAQIFERFAGTETTIGEIEQFVVAETAFRETHYRKILKEMEYAQPPGFVLLDPPPNRRRGTYPTPSQRLRFSQR